MGLIRIISRIIVGLVFSFSGFVKCVDPLGTVYKFEEYFEAFGIDSLVWFALPAAILMCAIELSIGLMLLFNIKIPWAAWLAVIFMAAFTPLTLILALTNPVSDCGCFGDALILTNWQSFIKNIIIDILVVIIFIERKKFKELFGKRYSKYAAFITLSVALGLEIFNLNRLPIIDFRPYKIGVNIPDAMIIPDDAPQPIYQTTLIYKKDGKTQEFTIDNYPQEGWEFVDTENKLIQKGYEPPIHDFSIRENGVDITDELLTGENYVFLLISQDLEKSSRKNQEEINLLAGRMMNSGYRFICLTNTSQENIEKFKQETGAPYIFGFTDQTTLKTIVRSNPGLILLKSGTIIDKWHHRNLPEVDELLEKLQTSSY